MKCIEVVPVLERRNCLFFTDILSCVAHVLEICTHVKLGGFFTKMSNDVAIIVNDLDVRNGSAGKSRNAARAKKLFNCSLPPLHLF